MTIDREEQKKDVNQDDSKFPTGQMVTLAICKFSEPIAFNSVIAYTFPMTIWLHNGDSSNASFYAGLLVSAYAFGEVLTAVIWGAVSDRVGRKPIVLFGLVGVAISCVMFGLARSYWVALVARLVGGALNGNVAVMQTMLAEMVKRPEHEPTAYAIHPFVWFAGGILGSAMGGYLSQPAHFYPHIFSPDGLFGTYPYLLPNIVSVIAIAIAVIQGMIFLKETNPILLDKKSKTKNAKQDIHEVSERTPLRPANHKGASTMNPDVREAQNESVLRHESSLLGEEGLPIMTGPHFDLRRSSFGTIHSIQVHQHQPPPSQEQPTPLTRPDLRTTFNFTVVMLIASLTLCSYHSMAYGNMLPIYLQDRPHGTGGGLDLQGGLGYNVHDVGSYMAASGLIAVLVQALVFPLVVGKFGVWKSWLSMILAYPFSYTLIPFLTLLPAGTAARSAGIYAVMLIQNHLIIIIPPCALILIKNATPSPLVLGTVNGACMSVICAARTVAPPLAGIIYGAAGSAACWFSMTGVAVVAVVQLCWVPRQPSIQVQGLDVDAVVALKGEDRGVEDGRGIGRRTLLDEEAVEN